MIFLKRFANLWTFLAVFCMCYFLETITFTYLITAVTSVERQFHIPSRQSGTLIAASDIGYVLTVVFLAYFGSKGNRAKWIGGGCVLISVACLIGSLPGLIFPAQEKSFDFDFVVRALSPNVVSKSDVDVGGILTTDSFDQNSSAIDKTPSKTSIISEAEAERLKNLAKLPFAVCDDRVRAIRLAIKGEMCLDKSAASGTQVLGFTIVFVSVALIGVGHSMPWTLGMPLIDDNVSKKNTPFFFAGVFFIRIMGPVLGFLIGGWSNKLYVTLKPPRGLSPTDPGWIGAWWLGFLIVSGGLLIPSLILFFFPRIDFSSKAKPGKSNKADRLQGDKNKIDAKPDDKNTALLNNDTVNKSKNGAMTWNDSQNVKDDKGASYPNRDEKANMKKAFLKEALKKFSLALSECLKSPVYLGCLIGRLFDAFAFKGFFVFQPKYLEHHYGVPQYKSNFYMAMMGIIGFAMGVLCGSILMRKLKLEGRRAAMYVGVSSIIASILAFSLVALGCDSVNNQINKDGRSKNFVYENTCNKDCHCYNQTLFPVCDSSGKAYFSPCHAGCRQVAANFSADSTKKFNFNMTDCSCVPNSGSVSKEYCRDDCKDMFLYYIIISIISGIVSGSQVIPGILMLFRSVPKEIRSVALGVSGFLVSLLSTFPSPIVFGLIIDTTCMLWESTCGSRGTCLLYDSQLLRVRIYVFQAVLRAVSCLFDIWVWYHAKNMMLMQDDEELSDKCEIDDTNEPDQNETSPVDESARPKFRYSSGEIDAEAARRSRPRPKSIGSHSVHTKRSSIVTMVQTFGSLYELELKTEGVETSPLMHDDSKINSSLGPVIKQLTVSAFNKLRIDQIDLKNKRILLRTDFNVPMKNGKIVSVRRIEDSKDTISYALKKGARCVTIISSLGRPKGRFQAKYSLKPVAEKLQEILQKNVTFLPNCTGPEVEAACKDPVVGSVILLENLRFHIEEEGQGIAKNGRKVKASKEDIDMFRSSLTKLGDVYVNDAFGLCHKNYSSIVGINAKEKVCGFMLRRELFIFEKVLEQPERPFLAILGGDKVAEKIWVIRNLFDKANNVIICGGMAFTFLKMASHMEIGDSVFDEKASSKIEALMEKSRARRTIVHFPVDFVTSDKLDVENATIRTATVESGIERGLMGLDIGPKSVENFGKIIGQAKTILWIGPPGVLESKEFSHGTKAVADAIVAATERGATTIVGGGDTAAFCARYGIESKISHICPGGAATLQLLEGIPLPGLDFLSSSG